MYFIRIIKKNHNKIIPININPHWNGMIKSQEEFFNYLLKQKIKILLKKKYPFNFLPKLFSYDTFYLIKKDFK